MKYYIISGEASGDMHGGHLMNALKEYDQDAQFRCWGGDRMEKAGGEIVKHYKDLAFMGFVEVLFNIRTILRNMAFCKEDLLKYQPDVLILIDYPGFNLRIAEFAHQHGIQVAYYISPQIWAWKKNRVFKIKKVVDQMYTILPFEKAFYQKYDYKVEYVGHPLLDELKTLEPNKKTGYVAMLPGSRKQEINKMLPVMNEVAKRHPDKTFVLVKAKVFDEAFYKEFGLANNVQIDDRGIYQVMSECEAAMVTSGTATLETALCMVPQVVCYEANPISYQIAKRIVDIKYISLVNLIMDELIVTELIQGDFTVENLNNELLKILPGEKGHDSQIQSYQELRTKLGDAGASNRLAKHLINKFKN